MLTSFEYKCNWQLHISANLPSIRMQFWILVRKNYSILQFTHLVYLIRLLYSCDNQSMFSHQCLFQTSKSGSMWYVLFYLISSSKILFSLILGAGIIYFLLYLPYTALINYDSQTRTWHKVIAVRIFEKVCQHDLNMICI